MASWMKTTSYVRPSRSVRISPTTCSHSGLRVRLISSISGDRSVSVTRAKSPLRCKALLPPPQPSSSMVGAASGRPTPSSTCLKKPASSTYSSGGESKGHHEASSPYILVMSIYLLSSRECPQLSTKHFAQCLLHEASQQLDLVGILRQRARSVQGRLRHLLHVQRANLPACKCLLRLECPDWY